MIDSEVYFDCLLVNFSREKQTTKKQPYLKCIRRQKIRLQIIKIINKNMKKFVLGIIATVSFAFNAIGQENNPYNATGVDFVKSLRILQDDYDSGKVKTIDKITTDYYLNTLPIKAEINEEVLGATVNAMKTSNYKEVINNSKLTDFAKQTLLQSQKNEADLKGLVEKVKKQKLSSSEEQTVLTSLAITYNLNQTAALSKCTVNGQTGPNACQVAGAIIGFALGDIICGPLCGIGGAIIGAIWGSTKD